MSGIGVCLCFILRVHWPHVVTVKEEGLRRTGERVCLPRDSEFGLHLESELLLPELSQALARGTGLFEEEHPRVEGYTVSTS